MREENTETPGSYKFTAILIHLPVHDMVQWCNYWVESQNDLENNSGEESATWEMNRLGSFMTICGMTLVLVCWRYLLNQSFCFWRYPSLHQRFFLKHPLVFVFRGVFSLFTPRCLNVWNVASLKVTLLRLFRNLRLVRLVKIAGRLSRLKDSWLLNLWGWNLYFLSPKFENQWKPPVLVFFPPVELTNHKTEVIMQF